MPEQDKEQRTERATPKRRRESREKGQVASSKEVSSAFVMTGSLLVLYFASAYMFKNLANLTSGIFSQLLSMELTKHSINNLFHTLLVEFFVIVAPMMIVTLVFSLASNIMQNGGLVFSSEAMNLKFSKLNPLQGVKKLVSIQSLAELIKSIFKIFIVGYIAYVTIKGEFPNMPQLVDMSVWQILHYFGDVSFKIFLRTILVLIVLAVIDYAFQRYEFEKSIKMTKEEIKREQKEAEGDPIIKARVRSVQKEMARRRMMKAVPEADVVITNPVRLAIALKYNRESMPAPEVVARGAGFIAKRIREIAKNEGVPIVENKPLARMLYKFAAIGEIIPERFYKAVAEILAYVYKLKGKA